MRHGAKQQMNLTISYLGIKLLVMFERKGTEEAVLLAV